MKNKEPAPSPAPDRLRPDGAKRPPTKPTEKKVYSVWNFPIGVRLKPLDVGLTCERYDCDYRIIKPLPEKLADMFKETDK